MSPPPQKGAEQGARHCITSWRLITFPHPLKEPPHPPAVFLAPFCSDVRRRGDGWRLGGVISPHGHVLPEGGTAPGRPVHQPRPASDVRRRQCTTCRAHRITGPTGENGAAVRADHCSRRQGLLQPPSGIRGQTTAAAVRDQRADHCSRRQGSESRPLQPPSGIREQTTAAAVRDQRADHCSRRQGSESRVLQPLSGIREQTTAAAVRDQRAGYCSRRQGSESRPLQPPSGIREQGTAAAVREQKADHCSRCQGSESRLLQPFWSATEDQNKTGLTVPAADRNQKATCALYMARIRER